MNSPDKPKRPVLRLQTMLIVVTVIAASWLGWSYLQRPTEQEVFEWVQGNGGEMNRQDAGWIKGRRHQIHLVCTRVSDLSPLVGFKSVNELYLSCTDVTDLSPLAGLTNIIDLNLFDTRVSDIAPLANLTNLKKLRLAGTNVSDLSPLAGLRDLEILDLTGTPVSDVSTLLELKKLKQLDLTDTQVGEEDLRALAEALPNCKIELDSPIGFLLRR